MVALLLPHCTMADLQATTLAGLTALQLAQRGGHDAVERLLRDSMHDPTRVRNRGARHTALQHSL